MPVSKSKQKQVLVSKKKSEGHQYVRRNTRYGTAKRTHRKSYFSRSVQTRAKRLRTSIKRNRRGGGKHTVDRATTPRTMYVVNRSVRNRSKRRLPSGDKKVNKKCRGGVVNEFIKKFITNLKNAQCSVNQWLDPNNKYDPDKFKSSLYQLMDTLNINKDPLNGIFAQTKLQYAFLHRIQLRQSDQTNYTDILNELHDRILTLGHVTGNLHQSSNATSDAKSRIMFGEHMTKYINDICQQLSYLIQIRYRFDTTKRDTLTTHLSDEMGHPVVTEIYFPIDETTRTERTNQYAQNVTERASRLIQLYHDDLDLRTKRMKLYQQQQQPPQPPPQPPPPQPVSPEMIILMKTKMKMKMKMKMINILREMHSSESAYSQSISDLVKAEEEKSESKSEENRKSKQLVENTLLVREEEYRIAKLKNIFEPFTELATNLCGLMEPYIQEIDYAVLSTKGAVSESFIIDIYNSYINELTNFFKTPNFKNVYISYATYYKNYQLDNVDNVDCGNLLILPIQRLPRYILFIKEVIKTSTQMKNIAQPIGIPGESTTTPTTQTTPIGIPGESTTTPTTQTTPIDNLLTLLNTLRDTLQEITTEFDNNLPLTPTFRTSGERNIVDVAQLLKLKPGKNREDDLQASNEQPGTNDYNNFFKVRLKKATTQVTDQTLTPRPWESQHHPTVTVQ